MPAVTESAMVSRLVTPTLQLRTPPITSASPESVTVVVPIFGRMMPGGKPVTAAWVK